MPKKHEIIIQVVTINILNYILLEPVLVAEHQKPITYIPAVIVNPMEHYMLAKPILIETMHIIVDQAPTVISIIM